ncbi:MAG: uncharacterized protein A8A55_0635 [Amphiamblys sp. WSBS2006]|nr:MAG: uncharacterized protein A8A55_0635 [Amphiamblys sp. WSBS2006]
MKHTAVYVTGERIQTEFPLPIKPNKNCLLTATALVRMVDKTSPSKTQPLISPPKLKELLTVVGSPNETLDPAVETIIARLSELFVDEMTQIASYFAHYRGEDKIIPEDYALALKQIYNITDISSVSDSY